MYIFISAIVTFWVSAQASALGPEFETVAAVITMGCFILYDNRRNNKKE